MVKRKSIIIDSQVINLKVGTDGGTASTTKTKTKKAKERERERAKARICCKCSLNSAYTEISKSFPAVYIDKSVVFDLE